MSCLFHLPYFIHHLTSTTPGSIIIRLKHIFKGFMQGRIKSRSHFDLRGGGGSIELPEYAIFIKLPEFSWMRLRHNK